MARTSRMIRYVLAAGLALFLAACGGSGVEVPSVCPQGGCISGVVVDTNDKPVPEMWLTAGDKDTQSSASGSFFLSNVAPGTHHLRGSGGTSKHYVLDVPGVSVSTGQLSSIGKKTAYHIFGMLIVEENVVGEQGYLGTPLSMPAGMGERLTRLPYEGTLRRQLMGPSIATNSSGVELMAAGGEQLIDDNGGYFYLAWEKTSGSPTYRIEYLGKNPSGNGETIWTSNESGELWDPNDPSFDEMNPVAYLDLDHELVDLQLEPGNVYYFRIATPDMSYPPIGLSLGSRITAFAGDLRVKGSGGSRAFACDEVPGADGYQVLVYTDDGQKVWDSGASLLGTTEVSASSANLDAGTYYRWYVDAHFLDQNGWVTEITRATSGLIW